MDINKANQATKIVNKIERCKNFLTVLDGRGYNDEFTIHYRGGETCELEERALKLLIDFYKKELKDAEQELDQL